jgi:ABC-type polar amino acid transport system ATPase subunit
MLRARIGMVFQNFELYPHMTALAECQPGADPCAQALAEAEADERSEKILARVGLGGKLANRPSPALRAASSNASRSRALSR